MASAATLELQIKAINQATAELQKLARDLRGLQQASTTAGAAARGLEMNWKSIGRTAAAVALGMGGLSVSITGAKTALLSTAGAAIQFESTFAGIRKTMDATEEEFARIAQANRQMAREIPLSVNEINRIGELAGQLGVRGPENLTKFERTVADLANTTNLTAEEAAIAFAQIANVMQLPIADVDRLGSAVVEMGNNFATTERDIVAFSQRIAGAARIAGLSAADVAGIATAFSSIGVEAEAGGTAVQKVLIDIRTAAATANDDLAVFARTAGMTADEFSRLARSDPAEAFVAFVEGLGRAGDDAVRILQELGLEDQRLIRAFLGVANAGDLLERAVRTSSEAFRENRALTVEAEKRYGTLQSQLLILRNQAVDVGISFGQALAPGVASAAQVAGSFLEHIRPLGPVLGAVARELPLVAAAAAAVGVALAGIKLGAFIAEWQLLGRVLLAEAGAIGAARTALSGLASAIMTPTGALLALSAALAAVDVGLRAFTGAGIIDHLTGAAKRAEEARRAQEEYNAALSAYRDLVEDLGGEERARLQMLSNLSAEAERLAQRHEAIRRDILQRGGFGEGPFAERMAEQLALDALNRDLDAFAAHLRAVADQVRGQGAAAVGDFLAELEALVARFPVAGEAARKTIEDLRDELIAARADAMRALGLDPGAALFIDAIARSGAAAAESAEGVQSLSDEVRELAAGYREATAAADDFARVATAGQDVERAALIAEIADLRAESNRLLQQGLPTEEVDKLIEEKQLKLEGYDLTVQQVDAHLSLLIVKTRDYLVSQGATWDDANARAVALREELTKLLATVPAEMRLQVTTELDQLSVDQVMRVVEMFRRHPAIRIPVLFEIATSPGLTPDQILRKLGATGFAQGGVVDKPTIALLGEREREYVIPESKLPRLQGGAGVGRAQSIIEAYFRAAAAQAAGAGGAGVDLNPLVELKRQLDAAGMSVERFAAALELIQEREEAARRATEDAARARIELEKLSIVLGQAGVSGEAFRTQIALQEVRKAFAQAGVEMDDLALRVASAAQNLDREFLTRIESLRGRAAELARKTGRPAFMIETGPQGVVIGNTRFAASGVLTEEGVRRTLERRPEFAPFIRQIEENGRTPAENLHALADAFKSFNGTIEEFRERLDKARRLREGLRRLPDLRGLSEALKKANEPPRAEGDVWESSLVRDPRTGQLVRQWVRTTNYYGPVTINSRAGVMEALDALSLGVR